MGEVVDQNLSVNPPNGRTAGEAAVDDEKVEVSAYNAVKADMHKYKEEARKNAEALKAQQDKEMRDKEQWKEYGAAKEKEANDFKTKYETLSVSIQERAKISAVREAAIKMGLVETAIDDLEHLNLSDVIVETTSTGRVQVTGAKSAAERIKSIRPHWFSNNNVPTVNGRTPEVIAGGSGRVTVADLGRLEAEAKKSGDYDEYRKKTIEFKQQAR